MKNKSQKNQAIKSSVLSSKNPSAQVNGIPFVRSGSDGSIAQQLARIHEECRLRKWAFRPDLAILDQPPRSAYRPDKGGALDQFVQIVRDGKLSASRCVIIIENIDRFSGAQVHHENSKIWEMVSIGLSLLFISNGLQLVKGDENDMTKRLLVSFELQRSASESARRSHFIKEAIRQKALHFYAAIKRGEVLSKGKQAA